LEKSGVPLSDSGTVAFLFGLTVGSFAAGALDGVSTLVGTILSTAASVWANAIPLLKKLKLLNQHRLCAGSVRRQTRFKDFSGEFLRFFICSLNFLCLA
jgi:hypothetical protein